MTAPLETTQSLCPICLARLSARLVRQADIVYFEKTCSDHGRFRVPVWRGAPSLENWRRPKQPVRGLATQTAAAGGCPFDCGLCPEHRQRSCTVLIEVTRHCDLKCAVCFADSGRCGDDPGRETVAAWLEKAWQATGGCNIQFSGGEPTLRDDLPDLVGLARRQGFDFIQINTNGLRLAREPGLARTLRDAGAASIFLQFDGTREATYRLLRGRPLLKQKRAAIEACAAAGLGVVLVPTLVPGVNTGEIGSILKTALEHFPTVRAVHFQPISYFGRYPGPPADSGRLTLPELMREVEIQSGGAFPVADFKPAGCENPRCSFHAQYLIDSQGRPRTHLSVGSAAASEESAEAGAHRAISFVARQWSAAPPENRPPVPLQPAACDCGSAPELDLDAFLRQARSRSFSVSAMAFQDVWNLDLERVRDCCIHVFSPRGRLIPFCLYNLTSVQGRPLYRE